MVQAVFCYLFTLIVSFLLIEKLGKKYSFVDKSLLRKLFAYHSAIFIVYFIYVSYSPSDSKAYFEKIISNYRGEAWIDFYGTSTTFIEFIGYPFVKFLGFTYETMMVLFSFVGFVGVLYFYLFFKENIRNEHKFFGVNLVTLIFFLPNLHFWTSSFGKGAVILVGIAFFFFGLNKVMSRLLLVFIGGLIIYHVRPHVMLMILVCTTISFVFSSRGIPVFGKITLLAFSLVAFFFIYQDVLSLVGIDEDEFISQGLDLSHRASELSKATSGVDINSYSLPLQLFTFIYRPLFFDAPGFLGIIVSFENVFYLLITFKVFNWSFLKFLANSHFIIKSALLSFISVSIALSQISGNLGLAIRQKSQVLVLFLFVILAFLETESLKRRRARISALKNEVKRQL
jgi:hypothetical protein